MFGEFGESFALVIVGFFVDVNVIEVPTTEGFEHAFAFGALDELGDSQTVERSFAVFAFVDEDDLSAVASHLRRERGEPATARSIAGTGFFEIAGNFPGDFGRAGRIRGLG
jgi:hypothetical protein